MFKLKIVARSLRVLAAGVIVCATLPAVAQNFQVANSTAGSQVAAAPINQIVANLNASISNATNVANVANSTANSAWAVGLNAQNTANWAGGVAANAQAAADWAGNVANNAQNSANNAAWRADNAWALGIADCAMAMGGAQWAGWCAAVSPRPW